MRRVLITGITGFVGSHLAEYLTHEADLVLYGLKRWRSPLHNIEHLKGQVTLIDGDLRDAKSMIEVIGSTQPDIIHHLAAQSYVVSSYSAPVDTIETNVCGTINLLEAVRQVGLDPVIHICSSSEVYGQVDPKQIPITEETPFRPASPYAVSKVGEDMVGYLYFSAYQLKTIRSRMFTHTGPRRGDVFVESSFAKQIAEIEKGIREPVVRVGNLDSVRTFLDVRDAVRAYWLLVNKGTPGEVYNIGGNETMSIKEMLAMLISMSSTRPEVLVDPARLRPTDVTLQIPDCSRFREVANWEPQIPIRRTLQDLLDYWRTSL